MVIAAIKLLGGIFMLAGMIIGAGMFAIPFSFAHAGFWLGTAELVFLGIAVVLVHLSYTNVVIGTPEMHRLPGYAGLYLGSWARVLASGSMIISAIGTLLVYLLLGSRFAGEAMRIGGLISLLDLFIILVIMVLGAAITYFPIRGEAIINGVLTAFLIGFIGFLVYLLFPSIHPSAIGGWEWENGFVPYGILLFALWGGVVIPDVATFFSKNPFQTRTAVIAGSVLPIIVYFLFSLAVVGVSGDLTSQEALAGLVGSVKEEVILLGALIGFLAVFTSLIALQKTFQAMLELDLGVGRLVAWAGASIVPFLLYLFGFTDFIAVIVIVGAVAIGIDVLLILALHYAMKKSHGISFSWFGIAARGILFCIIFVGIVYRLFFAGA
ncbi:MAG: Aromatic amino acid permease [Parcubacteria group bacterium GW2011_GWB1_50_9]|nr:MAG: Aromatic amino acid permease [Parcubacteria group bacterium GW2011_GWB1_50_9]